MTERGINNHIMEGMEEQENSKEGCELLKRIGEQIKESHRTAG
jgi:hypothetical protein